jgi:hypothetical protein
MVCNIMTSVPPFEVDSDMLARLGGVVFKVPPRRAVGCQFKSLNGNTGTNICDNCFLYPVLAQPRVQAKVPIDFFTG